MKTISNSRHRRGSPQAAQLTVNKTKESIVEGQLLTVRERGFTLIELLVVFGVLTILAGMVFAAVDPLSQYKKSKDAERKSDLSQIQKILEQIYQDNGGKYPTSSDSSQNCGSPPHACGYRIIPVGSTDPIEWGVTFSPYANVLPADPSSNKHYVYYSPPNSNGQTYYLYANLEMGTKDPQVCSGGLCSGAGVSDLDTACGGKCNYGVTSTNTSR